MNIITIGGSDQFTDEKLAITEVKKIIKKHKIKTKDLLVYGYVGASKNEGAYIVAQEVAKALKADFRCGNIKQGQGSWESRKTCRDTTLAQNSKILINLADGSKNGGKGIIDKFKELEKPVEVINSNPVKDTKSMTPKERRKGEIPSKEDLVVSVNIYSKVAQKLLEARCLMLDTETTGLRNDDEVVELSIGDCNRSVIVFDSLIKPSIKMSEEASKANGITDDMLEDAPSIAEVWPLVDAIVGNRVVLASHSTSETEWFDERLLNQSLSKHGLVCSFIWKDLQPLYRLYSCQLNARNYPLRTDGMCLQLGIEAGTHRAKEDVLAQIRILKAMAEGVMPNFDV